MSRLLPLLLAAMLAAPELAAARPPVLLIHGIKDDARKMEPMARYLRARGREVHTMSLLPSWGQKGLDVLAGQVKCEADRLFPAGRRFDLVGFSMGGLVCRYYLQRLGGLPRVHRFVTISSPHRGTLFAYLIPNAGCRQMRPGSPFLRDLARDADTLRAVGFTSLWTPLDAIIVPATQSQVPGAENVRIWSVAHPLMVLQPSALRAVEAALDRL